MNYIGLVVSLLALGSLARAAEGEDVPLALGEAVERAKASSARLAQLAALQDAAAAGLRGARAERWPQVDLQASYTRNSDVPELTLFSPGPPPTRQTVFPNIPDNYRGRAALALPLYTGGRIAGGVDAARGQEQAARHDRAAATADIVLETESAYWRLVTARESTRVLRDSIASYETHLKDAQNRFDLGLAARSELLAVQVERDRAQLARLQEDNRAEVANANLVRLVGLFPDARITPTEPVPGPARSQEKEGGDDLVAAALQARPEVAALRARLSTAEAQARMLRGGSLPQANVFGGYDYARPNSRVLPLVDEWKGTWSVGLSMSFTAFDGGRTGAAVTQARAQAEGVRHQLQDLEQRIRLEVTSRRRDLATAGAALTVAERALVAAAESVKMESDRYREGVGTSSDLLDAETRRLRAGLDLTVAVTDLEVARAGLDRAVGR